MVVRQGRVDSGGGLGQFYFYHLTGDWEMTMMTGRRLLLRASLVAAGLGLMISGGVATTAAAASNDNSIPAKALVGTWRVAITTFNCSTKVENPPFDSLLTFHDDGTMLEETSSLQFAAGQRTNGHGFWERMGKGAYRAVFEAFIMFPTAGPPPLQRGRQRVDQGITMTSRDSFTSDASVTFFNASGTVLLSGCARASGVRFE